MNIMIGFGLAVRFGSICLFHTYVLRFLSPPLPEEIIIAPIQITVPATTHDYATAITRSFAIAFPIDAPRSAPVWKQLNYDITTLWNPVPASLILHRRLLARFCDRYFKYGAETKWPTRGIYDDPTFKIPPDYVSYLFLTSRSKPTSFYLHSAGTENLTCRFIQLRKENGKLFTGRKYSAQAGWEYILRQMQEEFPTIMADVHYGVLKKKWSNLLQQYKELRNPVHGDRNKADDVSWPFYNAIDEVLGGERVRSNGEVCEEYIDPHEFLCVSVTPEEPNSPALPAELDAGEIGRRGTLRNDGERCLSEDGCSEVFKALRNAASREIGRCSVRRKRDIRNNLMSRLPRATELSIERIPVRSIARDSSKVRGSTCEAKGNYKSDKEEDRPRKLRRVKTPCHEDYGTRMERRLEQFFEYTKRRDEENRSIMMRIMHAVEGMASKV